MDFKLTERDFSNFRALIYHKAGINLHEGKKELLKARLAKYLRKSKFRSPREYYQYLIEEDTGVEMVHLLDAVSTNFTSFFREPAHYEFLEDMALSQLTESSRKMNAKTLRVWSAGCSTGEEPYSLAIVLSEFLGTKNETGFSILASDISTKVLKKASAGIYAQERLENVPIDLKRRYFQRGINQWADFFRVKPGLRRLITFKRVNLMETFPEMETFQIIFCRNVMIYFDKPTQKRIVAKFYHALAKGGFFFIGHAESLANVRHSFKYIRPSVYRKSQ